MKKVNLFLLAAGALAMTACSSNEKENDAVEAPVEIRLSSGLTMQGGTRAVDSNPLQATQIASGEKVYVWVDDRKSDGSALNTNGENYVQNWELTADGSGNLSGDAKYYPPTGGHIDVYCIHGNFSGDTYTSRTTYPATSTAWTHTVQADQSTDANYAVSDLLYGSLQNCKRQSAAHQVTFKHKLSKIEVLLKEDASATVPNSKLKDATVYVQNTKNTATFTFTAKAGAFTTAANADGYQDAYNSYGGTVAATGDAAEITMKKTSETVSDNNSALKPLFAEAIIVPQEVAASTKLLRIRLADGGDLFATLADATTFLPGKKYTYTVTVGLTEIKLSSTVSDWSKVEGNISATMDNE